MAVVCIKCSRELPTEMFGMRTKSKGKRYRSTICKPCVTARTVAWKEQNPEKAKAYTKTAEAKRYSRRMEDRYGISSSDYEAILREQDGVCRICKRHETRTRGKRQLDFVGEDSKAAIVRRLAIDHDHVTGKVRGLLCGACNTVLGLVSEDVAILNSVIEYLEEHHG